MAWPRGLPKTWKSLCRSFTVRQDHILSMNRPQNVIGRCLLASAFLHWCMTDTRWWQLKHFLFSPRTLHRFPFWHVFFFPDGLKPPTRIWCFYRTTGSSCETSPEQWQELRRILSMIHPDLQELQAVVGLAGYSGPGEKQNHLESGTDRNEASWKSSPTFDDRCSTGCPVSGLAFRGWANLCHRCLGCAWDL